MENRRVAKRANMKISANIKDLKDAMERLSVSGSGLTSLATAGRGLAGKTKTGMGKLGGRGKMCEHTRSLFSLPMDIGLKT